MGRESVIGIRLILIFRLSNNQMRDMYHQPCGARAFEDFPQILSPKGGDTMKVWQIIVALISLILTVLDWWLNE